MSDRWKDERKVVALPIQGSQSHEVVLARTLEKARAGYVKQVLVCIVWDDDRETTSVDWSDGKLSNLLYSVKHAEMCVEEQMRGRWEPFEEDEPGVS